MAMDHSVYTDCEFCQAVRYTEEANIGELIPCESCEKEFEVPDPTLRGQCAKCDDPFLICGDAGEKVACADCGAPIRFENLTLKEIKNPLKYGPKPGKDKGDEDDDDGASKAAFDAKRLAPLAALLLAGVGVWFFVLREKTPDAPLAPPPTVTTTPASPPTVATTPAPTKPGDSSTPTEPTGTAPKPEPNGEKPVAKTPSPPAGEEELIEDKLGKANDPAVRGTIEHLEKELLLMCTPFDAELMKEHAPNMGPAIKHRQTKLAEKRTIRETFQEKGIAPGLDTKKSIDEINIAMDEAGLVATTLLAAMEIAKAKGVDFETTLYRDQTVNLGQAPNIDEKGQQRLWKHDMYTDAVVEEGEQRIIRIKDIHAIMPDRLAEAVLDFSGSFSNMDRWTRRKMDDVCGEGLTALVQLKNKAHFTGGSTGTGSSNPSNPGNALGDIDADRKVYVAAVQTLREASFSRPAASWFISKHGTNPAASDKRMVKLLRGIYNLPGERDMIESPCQTCSGASILNQFCPTCKGRKVCGHCNGAGSKTMRSIGGEKVIPCTNCRRTGKCTVCLGAGSQQTGPCGTCGGKKVHVDRRKMAGAVKFLSDQIIRREQMFIKGSSQSGR